MRKKFAKKWIIFLLLLAVGVGYWRYSVSRQQAEVVSTQVERGEVKQKLELSGTVQADSKATVKFQTSGKLVWVGVKPGDRVKQYQALASLDQRQLKKSLQKQLNLYAKQRLTFEQTQDDNKDWQLIGDQYTHDQIKRILEKAQYDLDNSVIDVELQDLSVKLATIYSPIAGVVTYVGTQHPGVNVTPSEAAIQIIDPTSWYFDVSADDIEVVQITNQQPVEVSLDAWEDQQFTGYVDYISLVPRSTASGVDYQVKVKLPAWQGQEAPAVRMGMGGDAVFVVKQRDNTLWLPLTYVKQDQQGEYVYITPQLDKRYITTGLEGDDRLEILQGLSEGETVYLPQ